MDGKSDVSFKRMRSVNVVIKSEPEQNTNLPILMKRGNYSVNRPSCIKAAKERITSYRSLSPDTVAALKKAGVPQMINAQGSITAVLVSTGHSIWNVNEQSSVTVRVCVSDEILSIDVLVDYKEMANFKCNFCSRRHWTAASLRRHKARQNGWRRDSSMVTRNGDDSGSVSNLKEEFHKE